MARPPSTHAVRHATAPPHAHPPPPQFNVSYEDVATKFFEHFVVIAHSINGGEGSPSSGLYDPEDGFFYDFLKEKSGARHPVRIKSFVGLMPLFAVTTIDEAVMKRLRGGAHFDDV